MPHLRPSTVVTLLVLALPPGPAFAVPAADVAEAIVPFVTTHCGACHLGSNREGDVSLEDFKDEGAILKTRKTWTRALEQIRSGEMPPKDRPRPAFDDAERFTTAVQGIFERFDRTAPRDPGVVTMRRLNRAEYLNTIRDLVGVNIPLAEDFPADQRGHGFDSIGDMLTLSPVQLERYLASADTIVKAAIVVGQPPAPARTGIGKMVGTNYGRDYDGRGRLARDADGKSLPENEKLPKLGDGSRIFYDKGPLHGSFDRLATAGEYKVIVRLQGHLVGADPPQFAVLVDGTEVLRGVCGEKDEEFTVPVRLQPGSVDVGVSLLNEYTDPENSRNRRGIILNSLLLVSPTIPETHERLFAGSEKLTGDDRSRFVLERFATRAWRRPVAPAEIDRLLQIVHEAAKLPYLKIGPGSPDKLQAAKVPADVINKTKTLEKEPFLPEERFLNLLRQRLNNDDQFNTHKAVILETAERQPQPWEGQIGLALRAVLCSPHFLFRVEIDDQPDAKDAHPLDEFQLASRLSYFLWSSMPDDELFDLASRKQLHQHLPKQVKRMLADPRSNALFDNFATQWLGLRRLEEFTPAPEVLGEMKVPGTWADLRRDMLTETGMFFLALVREDRSIFDLIDAPFTFVNQRLAQLYDIGDTNGNPAQPKAKRVNPPGDPIPRIEILEGGQDPGSFARARNPFVRVSLENTPRGGLLTQASVLTVTSHPKRTSPVKRGDWVLTHVLGTPPPPPPPSVPSLEDAPHDASLSLRKQTELHRKDPNCAGCHARIDPIGFAFETFDPLGRYREKDGDVAIDTAGELPGGKTFSGAGELKAILKADKELLGRHLAENLLVYAVGRGLDVYDRRTVDGILAAAAEQEYRFQALIIAIVQSDAFRMRRGAAAEGSHTISTKEQP